MIATAHFFWPHGFLALGWTLLCAYGLLRTRKPESGPLSMVVAAAASNDSEWLWETHTSQPARDTQAGRI